MKKRIVLASAAAVTATIAWAAVSVGPVSGSSLDFPTLFGGTTGVSAAFPDCTVTGSGITVTAGTDCNIQPDVQTVTVYKMALCTAKPSAPTAAAATSLSACSTIFESTSATGSPVNIVLNTLASLPNGTVTKPANGTYNYLYVEVDPEVKIQASVQFSSAMGDANGVTTGAYCWSKAETTYNFSNNFSGPFPAATECGASAPSGTSVGATSSLYNSLMDDSGIGSGTGFTNSFVNLPTTAGGASTLDAYVLDTNGKLLTTQTVNSIGGAKRVVGIMTLPSGGVTVTDATSSIVLGYNNSKGAQISTQSGVTPTRVTKFGNGPFDMTVTAQ